MSLFVFGIPFLCFSQDYSLNDFVKCEIPEKESKEWYGFNNATGKEFVFTLNAGKIQVSKNKYTPYTTFDIPSGQLISINMGEFGGGLYYKANDTTKTFFVNGKSSKEINSRFFGGLRIPERNPVSKLVKELKLVQSGNVQFIFNYNDSICLLGGLSHMTLNSGYLQTLNFKDDSFIISKGLSLGDAPSAMCIYQDVLYLAGNKGFYMIDKNWKIMTIFDDLFWYGLYPISVAVLDKKNVFVTIRGGYVKINPKTKEILFYKAK